MDSEDKIVVSVIKLFPAFGQYATKSSVLLCKQFFFILPMSYVSQNIKY